MKKKIRFVILNPVHLRYYVFQMKLLRTGMNNWK